MKEKQELITKIAAIITAIILLQTLFYKFSAAPESVYIFETVGLEPFGRIGIGVLELITSFLLLMNRTRILGALLGIVIISGAIFLHLTKLGIEVMNDGGLLFYLAVTVFVLSSLILILNKNKILKLLNIKYSS
jgi:hypothetical protein